MVKNITIKDEAYEYLKKKKGKKSFSDVILQESQASYNQKTIQLNAQAFEALQELKGMRSFSDVILDLTRRTKPAKEFLYKFYGILSEKEGQEYSERVKQVHTEMEREFNDRS